MACFYISDIGFLRNSCCNIVSLFPAFYKYSFNLQMWSLVVWVYDIVEHDYEVLLNLMNV